MSYVSVPLRRLVTQHAEGIIEREQLISIGKYPVL
jgi:hypothetical protein